MIELEKELGKFKPMMDINTIEEHIREEDTKDMVDMIREILNSLNEQGK